MEVKYDKIGVGYNETRKADTYLTQRLLYHLNPIKDLVYLDIGCGTGNYTNALASKSFSFIGIDPSQEMLEKAQQKNPAIKWKLGAAENTELRNESIDGVIASLTIHHWESLNKAFKELFRILKPQANIVIFTSTPKQMEGYWLNHYFPKMMHDSIKQMPTFIDLEIVLLETGFSIETIEKYFVKPDLEDLFLYAGKYNPELYFDSNVRRGISSFSSLSYGEEVETGLTEMKKDMKTGKINELITSYENDLGDYLFVVAKKN